MYYLTYPRLLLRRFRPHLERLMQHNIENVIKPLLCLLSGPSVGIGMIERLPFLFPFPNGNPVVGRPFTNKHPKYNSHEKTSPPRLSTARYFLIRNQMKIFFFHFPLPAPPTALALKLPSKPGLPLGFALAFFPP